MKYIAVIVLFIPQLLTPFPLIIVGETPIVVMLARNGTERSRGLSYTQQLPSHTGMLFTFPYMGQYTFWMKDMRYPIDIAWISDDGVIVHIEQGVRPDSYPKTFTNREPAQYVLEVPEGFFATHNISLGDTIQSINKIKRY